MSDSAAGPLCLMGNLCFSDAERSHVVINYLCCNIIKDLRCCNNIMSFNDIKQLMFSK